MKDKNSDPLVAIDTFTEHATRFEADFVYKNKEPRKQNWRPHRFCVRDIVLAIVATRYNSFKGSTDVDLFASYNPIVFDEYSGTKIGILFILSDAFMSGSTMDIQFTNDFGSKKVEIPSILQSLALDSGMRLQNSLSGMIGATEAKRLYFELTDLSPSARDVAVHLNNSERITVERICFMVNNQIWTSEEMEMILTGARWPEDVLFGDADPLNRQLFLADLFQASGPILGSLLTRKLLQKETTNQKGEIIDIEAADNLVKTSFDPRFYAKKYELLETLQVPWLVDDEVVTLDKGQELVIMVRPRSSGHLMLFGWDDIRKLAEMADAYKNQKNVWLGVLYPQDFFFTKPSFQGVFVKTAKKLGINVIVSPEILENIDASAMQKLERSRLIRR